MSVLFGTQVERLKSGLSEYKLTSQKLPTVRIGHCLLTKSADKKRQSNFKTSIARP